MFGCRVATGNTIMKHLIRSTLIVALLAFLLPSRSFAGEILPSRPSIWTGCFVDVTTSGRFARLSDGSNSVSMMAMGAGAGCDFQMQSVVVGGRLGLDLGKDDMKSFEMGMRVGYTVNPYVLAYGGLSILTAGDHSINPKDSVLAAKVGVETFVWSNVTLFIEASRDVAKFGIARDLSDVVTITGGARLRL